MARFRLTGDGSGDSGDRPVSYGVSWRRLALVPVIVVALGGVCYGYYLWHECWFKVESGKYMPLLKKEGKDFTSNLDVMQVDPAGKGPLLEVLGEGRYLKSAYDYWWPTSPMQQTEIPPDKVGVLVRKYGTPLPPGRVLANTPDEKGVLDAVLMPGSRNLINEWAYAVELDNLVTIPAGFMGIITLLDGTDPKNANDFIVQKGERGTQPYLLPNGTHPEYSNPYKYRVIQFDCRSQKLEIGKTAEVKFLSIDGFEITMKGTIEWSVILDMLPRTFVIWVEQTDLRQSGGLFNLRDKLLLPAARSWARIHGSKHKAIDFIPGDTKIQLQQEIGKFLKDECAREGVEVRSFVLHDCDPPPKIREQYARREMARQQIAQYRQQIMTEIGSPVVGADGKPKLDKDGQPVREGGRVSKNIETRRKDREERLGSVKSEVAKTVREAEQYMSVQVLEAQQILEVAQRRRTAAQNMAEKTVAEGTAKADVKVKLATAKADGVKAKVLAFTGGDKYADFLLAQKLAPAVRRIFSNTDGAFVELWQRYIKSQPAK